MKGNMKLKINYFYAIAVAAATFLKPEPIVAADVTGDRGNIGQSHVLTGGWATIGGGNSNTNRTYGSTIGGGIANMIDTNLNDFCTISGGEENIIFSNS